MLEKFIAGLLVPYLSKFVENIDERQLNIDIWSGKATLHDLVLKRDVLNTFLGAELTAAAGGGGPGEAGTGGGRRPLPIRIHRGICKSVTLDIPLTNLRSRPVVVSIGEILITLVAPDQDGGGEGDAVAGGAANRRRTGRKSLHWDRIAEEKARALDAFEERRRKQREEAAAAAAATAAEGSGGSGGGKKDSFFSKLGETIINNVIVKAKAVHIRYEDTAGRVVLGAVLGGVQLLTVDDSTGEVAFVDPSNLRRVGKRLELEGLQVYCDDPRHMTANEMMQCCWTSQMEDWQGWYNAMRRRARDGNVALSTVFGPVTCSVDMRIVFKRIMREMLETPSMTVTTKLQHIIAHLTRAQYTTIVKSISRFTNWSEVAEVAARRPRVPVKGNAKVWWRFAVHTVMSVLREPRRAHLMRRISATCRMDYQVLYRDVVRKTEMPPEKKRVYRFITRFMTVEDMIEGRQHVYEQLATQIHLRRRDKDTKKAEATGQGQAPQQRLPPPPPSSSSTTATQPQKRGWLHWLRGSSEGDPNGGGADAQRTREEKEEEDFFRALEKDYGITATDSDAETGESSTALAPAAPLPPDYVWLLLSLEVPFMSYQIDMEEGESACLSVFQLYGQLRSFNAASSVQFHFSVEDLTLSNPTTRFDGGAMVPHLIEGASPNKATGRRSASSSPTGAASRPILARTASDVDGGKQRANRIPTLCELLGVASGSGPSPPREHSRSSSTTPTSGSSTHAQSSLPSSPTSVYTTPLLSVGGALHPVEQPLADTKLDAVLCVKLLPLRVVADPGTIRRVLHFFRVPKGVDLSHFTRSTYDVATAVGTAASQELRTAMATAKGLFVSVDASAPILLFPKTLRATTRETTLAVSLGRIRFQSQPLTESEKTRRLKSSRETEEMLYYSSRASFSRFFVELTTLEDALHRPETGMMVVPNLAVAADVLQRIDERNDYQEKVILRLKVPKLTMAASVHQAYLLTDMVHDWLQDWTTGASSTAVQQTRKESSGVSGYVTHRGSLRQDHSGDSDAAELTGRTRAASGEPPTATPHPSRGGGGNPSAGGFNAMSVGGVASAVASSSSSPLAPPLVGRQDDLPLFRVELLVESLGLRIHEDDPDTLAPIVPARFSLNVVNAEFLMGVGTTQKMLLYLEQPCVVDLRDPDHAIVQGTTAIRVDVGMAPGTAVAIGVVVEPSLRARVGTPLIELLETVMDVVNLMLSCVDDTKESPPAGSPTSPFSLPGTPSAGASSSTVGEHGLLKEGPFAPAREEEDARRRPQFREQRRDPSGNTAYQLALVRLQNTMPDLRLANISVHIHGVTTVELLNRELGASEDHPFASVSISDVSLFMKRNSVTMEITGKVAEAAAHLADRHGLLKANNCVLCHTLSSPAQQHSSRGSACDDSLPSLPKGAPPPADRSKEGGSVRNTQQPAPNAGTDDKNVKQPHIAFTYRKGRPIMPTFVTQTDGKRVLSNAAELRYSNAIELELGASTVTLDVHTVMLLKLYFTTGFFSRLSLIGDRPVYNGRALPPPREGPRLLMSVRVVAGDITVALPLDASRSTDGFRATVGNLVVQSSLHAWEGQQTMSVSLHELALWMDDTSGTSQHSLLPTHAYVEVALRSPIDLESDNATLLDIRSEGLQVDVTSEDLLNLCRLIRCNVSCTEVDPSTSVAAHPIRRVFVKPTESQHPVLMNLGDGDVSAAAAVGVTDYSFASGSANVNAGGGYSNGNEMAVNVRLGRVAFRFSGEGTSFELGMANAVFQLDCSSYAVSIAWKSLTLLDTRGGNTSTLLRCDEGEVYMIDSLTTQAIVMSDFAVRPSVAPKSGGAAARDEDDASSRVGRPCEGGMDSITSSDATATLSQGVPPKRVLITAAETGAESTSGTGGGFAHRPRCGSAVSRAAADTAVPGRELMSVKVLSVVFTLRRLAVSDQWLNLYDYFCNEAVMAVWSAPPGRASSDSRQKSLAALQKQREQEGPLGSPSPPSSSSGGGFRCTVTTPSVVVPFLTAAREPLFEASIGSLLVDTVSFPGADTQVAVKVKELEVVDGKSGECILTRRRRPAAGRVGEAGADEYEHYCSSDDEGDAGVPAGYTAGATQHHRQARQQQQRQQQQQQQPRSANRPEEPEALHFLFKTVADSHRSKISLSLGRLDALCSMPLLYGMMDYFLSPTQPIARISSLGVMKEQRERIARAAKEMADQSALSIQVLWHQPKIIFAGDGVNLRSHARRLEARLGTMRATVSVDKPNDELSVSLKVRDFCIPTLLEKSALHVACSSNASGMEVKVNLDRVVGLFFPADVDKLVYVIRGNVALPRESCCYYGRFAAAEDTPTGRRPTDGEADTKPRPDPAGGATKASSSTSVQRSTTTTTAGGPRKRSIGGSASPLKGTPLKKSKKSSAVSTPAPSPLQQQRQQPGPTILVLVSSLVVAVHDFAGINTHTVSLSSLSLITDPAGNLSMAIPTIDVTEHFTNSSILSSGGTNAAGARVGPGGTPNAAPRASSSLKSASPSEPPPTKPAIALSITDAGAVTTVAVSEVIFALVPRGTGVLLNTLLSVQVPQVDVGVAAAAPAATEKPKRSGAELTTGPAAPDTRQLDSHVSEGRSTGSAPSIEAPIPPSRLGASGPTDGSAQPSGGRTVAATPAKTLKLSMDGCGLRFVYNEANVAFAEFSRVAVEMESYRDGSGLTRATVEDFTLMDSLSENPTTRWIVARFDDEDDDKNNAKGEGAPQKLLDFTLWTAPPADALTRTVGVSPLSKESNLYARRVSCEVAHLSFTLVPDVVKPLGGTVSEVMQYVSEVNRGRAYDYVSDTATAAAEAVVSKTAADLTELEVIVHRPRLVVLPKADAEVGVELFPGRIFVRSELGVPEGPPASTDDAASPSRPPAKSKAPPSSMSGLCREIFQVKMERMNVKVLNVDAFKRGCHVSVLYESALPSDAAPHQEMTELRVSIPSLAMNLSHAQSQFLLDVLGAFMDSDAGPSRRDRATVTGTPPVYSGASSAASGTAASGASTATRAGSGSLEASNPARRRGSSPLMMGSASPLAQGQRSQQQTQRPAAAYRSRSQAVRRRRPAANSQAVSRVVFFVNHIEADLAEVFRLHVDKAEFRAESSEAEGSHRMVKVKSMRLQHVGAEVEVADGSTGERRSARVDDLVDLLTVRALTVHSISSPMSVDEETMTTSVESAVDVAAEVFRVAVSPTILFDTREILYLPFYSKVLRQPVEPIPVLMLKQEVTHLTEDLFLDATHIVLTGNRRRCCYELDLNGHTLAFTGDPSAQIVLNEGCELTISNGTVSIPGLYSIGSFVSYAAATSLHATDTCTIQKQYQGIPNMTFAVHSDAMKAAASASYAAGGGGGGGVWQAGEGERRAAGAGALPSPDTYHSDSGLLIQQRKVRLTVNFSCPQVVMQVLSEETPDLSMSICTEAELFAFLESENDEAVRRNASVRLLEVRSGEKEEHTLLPTSITGTFSGVDSVSLSVVCGPLELCSRAVLLRSFVEIGKDFGAAFIEENTIRRFRPTVQLETPHFEPLVAVASTGQCQHCGQHNASLSKSAKTAGTLCYRCCTGHESVPVMDIRVEIPQMDIMVLGSSGDIGYFYISDVVLSVDPNMDAQLTMKGALHIFNNAAAVWEPLVEPFTCKLEQSIQTHDYKIQVDRLDFVVSPLYLRALSRLASDFASTTTLQKRMRKKFRRRTQQHAAVPYSTAPMYVEGGPDDDDDDGEDGDGGASAEAPDTDDDMTFGSTIRSIEGGRGGVGLLSASLTAAGNASVFDFLSATQRHSVNGEIPTGYEATAAASPTSPLAKAPPKVYAHAHVVNHCDVALLVDGRLVNPRGGSLSMKTSSRHLTLTKEHPRDSSDDGYVLPTVNPALYVQAKDFLIETKGTITRDETTRALQRVVDMAIFPLHNSKTLICVENRLSCSLVAAGDISGLAPGGRCYLPALADLNAPLVVQLGTADSQGKYAPGVTEENKTLTLQEVLTGIPFTLVCRPVRLPRSTGNPEDGDGTLYVRVVVRQDAIRGGIPTFTIAIEPRFWLSNKLPYSALVSVAVDKTGNIAKGRAEPKAFLQTVALEAMHKTEIRMGPQGIKDTVFVLEVQQAAVVKDGGTASGSPAGRPSPLRPAGSSRAASPRASPTDSERFVSAPVPVNNSDVRLTSTNGRELVVRVMVVGDNVLLTTPFAILNHTHFPLTLRECDKKGNVKRVDVERNYSVLPPSMDSCFAAFPCDGSKEEFFVNMYSGMYSAKVIPFHVQQRGLILMEEVLPSSPEKAKKKGGSKKDGDGAPAHGMLHLAYVAMVDASGAIRVTITPRWIVVNRSPRLPLYIAPTAQAALSAVEAGAAAAAQVAAENASRSSPAGSPTSQQMNVDAFKKALLSMADLMDSRLTDTSYVVPVGPMTAEPLYRTPYCIPEVGYHAHILQSPDAPLYGCPVQLETIHNETVVAYSRRPDDDESAEDGEEDPPRTSQTPTRERDCFLEVSLASKDSYTFIVVEEPDAPPFILLNRTRHNMELRDTALKSAGRLMARAPSGCGTAIILDSTANTVVRVVLTDAGSPVSSAGGCGPNDLCFDVGRPMTAAERVAAKGGLLYQVTYGEQGQVVLEVYEAKPLRTRAQSSRASPPAPLNVLVNVIKFTASVVVPGRDVLFADITDTRVSWTREKRTEEVQFSVANFQVDNQSEVKPRYHTCLLAVRRSAKDPAISGIFKRTVLSAKGLLWFDEIRLDITPVALRVSDTLLVCLARFARMLGSGEEQHADATIAVSGSRRGSNKGASLAFSADGLSAILALNRCPTKQQLFDDAPRQMDFMATRILLDKLIVNPLLVRLWLTRDNDGGDFFRDGLRTKEASLLSMMVASCEDVSISAPGLVAVGRSSRLGVLLQWIAKVYTDGLFARLQGVLLQYAASLPLIGAPVKLFSGIGSGAVRLFREPVEGLSTSPKAFAQGLARGSSGFAASLAGGGLGAFANLTDAGSRLLSMAGGVSERDRRRQNTWTGLINGLTGVVQRPLEGAAESGAAGFVKGAAHGVVGLLADPASGLLSDASRYADTMAEAISDSKIPATDRLRPIRFFYANGGIAQWGSVSMVYLYEPIDSGKSLGSLLFSRSGAVPPGHRTSGDLRRWSLPVSHVPSEKEVLDRYDTNFEGWTFSTKVFGYYTGVVSSEARVRRKRWAEFLRPLPHAPIAYHLGVFPGMAKAGPESGFGGARGSNAGSRAVSMDLSAGSNTGVGRQATSTVFDYANPGMVVAVTVREAKTRWNPFRHSRDRAHSGGGGKGGRTRSSEDLSQPRHGRHYSGFFGEEEWAAGKTTAPRTPSTDLGAGVSGAGDSVYWDVDGTGGSTHTRVASSGKLFAVEFQRPSAPRGSGSGGGGGGGNRSNSNDGGKWQRQHTRTTSRSAGGGSAKEADSNADERLTYPVLRAQATEAVNERAPAGQRPAALEETLTVEVYEYQRKSTLFGWVARGLPSECPRWQDTQGRAVQGINAFTAKPGWRWSDDWHTVGGAGKDGWLPLTGDESNLRRRLWHRTMAKNS